MGKVRYLNKISGPLLDRIDIQIEIVPVPFDKISDQRQGEASSVIRNRVIQARRIQEHRKSVLGKILENSTPKERVNATVATTVLGVKDGVDIVRVHDVKENKEAAMVADAIYRR